MTTTSIILHKKKDTQIKTQGQKITRKAYLANVDDCIKHVSSSVELFEKVNQMGKVLGYTSLEIGKDFKQRAKALGKSDRTIQRFLPPEFKGKPRGATTHEKISAKMALNEEQDNAAIRKGEVETGIEPPEPGADELKDPTSRISNSLELELQEDQSIPVANTPEVNTINVLSRSEQIEQLRSQDEEKLQQWRQQQINLGNFNPALISTYDREYLESVLTYYYQEHQRLVSTSEVTRLERQRNDARRRAAILQEKNKELVSKLSLYQRSSRGLRWVENLQSWEQKQEQKQKEKKEKKSYAPLEEVQEHCRKHGIKTKREYWDAALPENFPKTRPDHTYHISWDELLGKGE